MGDVDSLLSDYAKRVLRGLSSVDNRQYEAVIGMLFGATESNRRVWLVGNGGSAAIADHFATDLLRVGRDTGRPFRASSLTSNVSTVTAAANDYGYENVFATQIALQVQDGDVVIAISSSGNSVNVLNAVVVARERGCRTVGMVGFDGGSLASLVDMSLLVRTALGDYGVAEDCHSALCHSICEALRRRAVE